MVGCRVKVLGFRVLGFYDFGVFIVTHLLPVGLHLLQLPLHVVRLQCLPGLCIPLGEHPVLVAPVEPLVQKVLLQSQLTWLAWKETEGSESFHKKDANDQQSTGHFHRLIDTQAAPQVWPVYLF
jgi:hypothetical protein